MVPICPKEAIASVKALSHIEEPQQLNRHFLLRWRSLEARSKGLGTADSRIAGRQNPTMITAIITIERQHAILFHSFINHESSMRAISKTAAAAGGANGDEGMAAKRISRLAAAHGGACWKDRKTNVVDLTTRNSELSLCFTFYLFTW
jgi:hypothetical protein